MRKKRRSRRRLEDARPRPRRAEDEGYIRGYTWSSMPRRSELRDRAEVFRRRAGDREIERVSKPGRRVYSSVKDLPRVNNGLGISILSTPKGVMADHEARDANVGGEVLCTVF
jgi:small subunit ribosomal protein S8